MFKRFSEYVTEATKEVTFTFGRFNPPTIGHEKLLDAVAKVARGGKYLVYASQSTDPKKNPLDYQTKVKYMRKMFPRHARSVMIDPSVKNVFDILVKLYDQGYNKVNMVVGSDRVPEFEALISKYNGVKGQRFGFYNFESGVNVVSAGERDPDADDVSGMSASKMRAAASSNDFATFSKGLPKGFKEGNKLFNDVRKGMGLKESFNYREHVEFQPVSEAREQYVAGELFAVGDSVVIKESEEVCNISVLGSNYVIVEMSDGRKLRKWIDSVEKLEEHVEEQQTQIEDLGDKILSFSSFNYRTEDTGTVKHHQFQKTLKHGIKHAYVHKDLDVDSDVDALDKNTPDELIGTEKDQPKKMFAKYSKEKQHTRPGVAFETKGTK